MRSLFELPALELLAAVVCCVVATAQVPLGATPGMPMPGMPMPGMPMPGMQMPGNPMPGASPLGGAPLPMPGAPGAAGAGVAPTMATGGNTGLMINPAQIDGLVGMSEKTVDIVHGIVEAFLHKSELVEGELECITTGVGQLAGNFMLMSSHTVMLIQQMYGLRSSPFPSSVDSGLSGSGVNESSEAAAAAAAAAAAEGKLSDEEKAVSNSALDFYYGNNDDGNGTTSKDTSLARRMQVMPGQMPLDNAAATIGGTEGMAVGPMDSIDPIASAGMSGAAAAMGFSTIFMELGICIQQVVHLSQDIASTCVQDDAREAFKIASEHLRDIKYVGGRLMANGADVLNELADGVIAFEHERYTEFGTHLGSAMRQVFLSNNTNQTLPEGLPGQFVLANMTAGLIDGFFGTGFALDVRLPYGEPIHVDMHQCMADNIVFFQSVWSSAMFFFGKKAAEHKVEVASAMDDEALKNQRKKDHAELGTAMALTMMQMPSALRRCDITKEQEEALVDSIRAFGDGLSIHFQLPEGTTASTEEATDHLAKAIKDWAKMQWYTFGFDLGQVLQQMVLVMFPQKYSANDAGGLRKLLRASGASSALLTRGSAQGFFAWAGPLALTALIIVAGAVMVIKRRAALSHGRNVSWTSMANADREIEGSLPMEGPFIQVQ